MAEHTAIVWDDATGELTEDIQGHVHTIPHTTCMVNHHTKSQGLTFRACDNRRRVVVCSGTGVDVALSRCKSLEGMVLATPITPEAMNDRHQSVGVCQPAAERSGAKHRAAADDKGSILPHSL